jgi:hypothetical protein
MGGGDMRGMQPLVAMRRAGYKPSMAFVDVDSPLHTQPVWSQWQHNTQDRATIDIPAGEMVGRIDWRPLLGMVVNVSGTDAKRVKTVAHAIEEAGAKRVVYTLLEQIGQDEFVAFKTVWMYDTAGVIAPREAHGAHA